MIDFEKFSEMVNELANELPEDLFRRLNGGINILPQEKLHREARSDDLYVLGEYCRDNLGRYINIYHGSFMKLYTYETDQALRERVMDTLKHEFLHHLESMAGEDELERKDAYSIAKYKSRFAPAVKLKRKNKEEENK